MTKEAKQSVNIKGLSFRTSTGRVLFSEVSMTLYNEKIVLLGRNGIGKTTFLRLLNGDFEIDEGSIETFCTVTYIPQVLDNEGKNVIEVLNEVIRKQNILRGKNRKLISSINKLIPADIEQDTCMQNLSCGEQRRIFLAEALSENSGLLLLDEPESDLDIRARELLSGILEKREGGFIMITHDRRLARSADNILELSEQGFAHFKGTFDDFVKYREEQNEHIKYRLTRLIKDVEETQIHLDSGIRQQKKRMMRAEYDASEKGLALRGPFMTRKDRSTKTVKRLRQIYENKVSNAESLLKESFSHVRFENSYRIIIENPRKENNQILGIESLYFSYGEKIILHDLNININSGDRICLSGLNGSGKTTLIKIILGDLNADQGVCIRKISSIAAIDQLRRLLDKRLSLIENIEQIQYGSIPDDIVEHSGFPPAIAGRKCSTYSAGELMIATLIFLTAKHEQPELLILDEPTNFLDMNGIACLESILQSYTGAFLLVSHDITLLQRTGITRTFQLEKGSIREFDGLHIQLNI